MLHKYTKAARGSIAMAEDYARQNRCQQVAGVHLLQALYEQKNSLARMVLEELNLSLNELEALANQTRVLEVSNRTLCYDQRCIRAFVDAWQLALSNDQHMVNSAHLLLALLNSCTKDVADFLRNSGLDEGMLAPLLRKAENSDEKGNLPLELESRMSPELLVTISFAEREAKRLGRIWIGTEFFLLGLLNCVELPSKKKKGSKITLQAARQVLDQMFGPGEFLSNVVF